MTRHTNAISRKHASAGPAISFHIVLMVQLELYELFPELSYTLKVTHMLRPRPNFLTRGADGA